MSTTVACQPFIAPGDITCDCGELTDEELEDLIDAASDAVAILTGGQVSGRCTQTYRPTRSCPTSWTSDHWPPPPFLAGHPNACRNPITLPGPDPIVDEVRLGGQLLTPSVDYAILNGRQLVRIGRNWPEAADIFAADSQPNTFSLAVTYGQLPYIAQRATAEIVCSWIKQDPASRQGKALDPRARSTTVAGVNIQLEEMAMEIKRRAPFLPEVIRLLTIYAPDGPTPAVVYSPEIEDGWTLNVVS